MSYRTEIHFIKKEHFLFNYCNELRLKSKKLNNHANYLIHLQLFYLETFHPCDGKEHGLYFQVEPRGVQGITSTSASIILITR